MGSPLTYNLERVACVTLYLKSSALELTIYQRNSRYRTFWELILKIKNSARSSPWEEFSEEQVLSTKAEFQEIASTLIHWPGERHRQPPCLSLPREVPVGSCDLLTHTPFNPQSPILDSILHSHPAKRCPHATAFFPPLCGMVEPKEKGYFYKLRGVPFCRRGILPAFSIQRLSAPSLWVGNVGSDYFTMPFLVYVTVLVSKTHWGTLPFLESHGLLPLRDALIYFHVI